MAIPGQDSYTIANELQKWWKLYFRELCRSRYKAYAEDVASHFIKKMVTRMKTGQGPRTCPDVLPRVFRQEAMRVAQKMASGSAGSGLDLEMIPTNVSEGDDESLRLDLWESISRVFNPGEIDKLVGQCHQQGEPRRKDLAAVIRVSERTLRYRFQRARSLLAE